jgi:hypothetical protein
VPYLPSPARTVHRSGFVQFGTYAGNSGQIDNYIPAHALPNTQKNIAENPVYRFIAESLLRTGEYRVSELAEQCGYSDVHHFYKQFKVITGKPPSLYLPQKSS